MKKTMILAAFAALVSLASCQKEDNIINGTDNQTSPVFTASIAGATRTTVNLTDGKVAWEEADEITVTDASSASAVYEIESIDASTGEATFVIKDGETALGSGPYTATYGTEPATAQTYSATAGKLYMTAESSTNSFTFTVQCGLMKLNLTKTDVSVKSIAVTGTPTDGTETTYTLTCTEAQSIATAKDFCIALPEGSYTKIVITNATDDKCYLNSKSGLAVEANHIKPVTFGTSKIKFTTGTAPASFDNGITITDVKWIQLWKDGPKFAEFNVGAANNKPEDFGDYFKGPQPDVEISDRWGDNWKTPTEDDFTALISECTFEYATVGGVNGWMISGMGDYSSNSIFLPAAGQSSSREGEGWYWTGSGTSRQRPCLTIWESAGTTSKDMSSATAITKMSIRPVLNETEE